MTREELDRQIAEMTWEDQNWLFNRIMYRLWPELAGKKVVFHEATGFYEDDESYTEEDDEYFKKKWEKTER